MKVVEKIKCLQNSLNLKNYKFAHKYHMSYFRLIRWYKGKSVPSKNELSFLCKKFNISLDDFMNESLHMSAVKPTEEHYEEKTKNGTSLDGHVIYEDFPREDNSRYEEKD